MIIKRINSLYIHIPFCNSICPYCDFSKLLINKTFVDKYLKSLINELNSLNIDHKLKTIYIGGGTPSSINLESLLIKLEKYVDIDTEFSIEMNPIDVNENLLSIYKKYHVNRVSLGVQSLNDNILKVLGRKHNKEEIINKISLIKKYINNINVDLIYGFKELNNKILKEELKEYIKLDVNHISTYCLEIHEGTKFYNDGRKELDSSLIREQFDIIYDYLINNNFNRYEISNFSKLGFESKHNINYWKDNEYYGIGLSAASYIDKYRYKNTLNFSKYIKGIYIDQKEFISNEDDKKYYLLTNLRLTKGIHLDDYYNRFNISLYNEKKKEIDNLIKRNLLILTDKNIKTTFEGSMLLDIILKELF